MQNGYVENFNSLFRDECLNESWFITLAHARVSIEQRLRDYDHARPYSSLVYRTRAECRIAAVQPVQSLVMTGS